MVRRETGIKRKQKQKEVRRQQSGASSGNEEKVREWKECRGRGRSGERRRRVQEADLKGKNCKTGCIKVLEKDERKRRDKNE